LKTAAEIIRETETRWYESLDRHCRGLFSGSFLPSHDHSHHARVWSYARSLLLLLDENGTRISRNLAEELIIASFFHDTGLIRTSSERHGRESRRFCEEFFSREAAGIPKPATESLPAVLNAIEHHDDKSLRKGNPAGGSPEELPGLLSLLSCADDLDAFGYIGIYRYAEIYLMRGLKPEQLPGKVCENVKSRFDNIKSGFVLPDEFLKLQESRFLLTYEFYLHLAQAYAAGDERPSWEPGLIALIASGIRDHRNLLKADRELPAREQNGAELAGREFDKNMGDWFRELDAELKPHLT
jgi:HD superfamily phosphodiesterase